MNRWRPEVFAYFDHPITNAYTESLNSLIKLMYHVGRGYSFDALRAKILYTKGIHKTQPRPTESLRSQRRVAPADNVFMYYWTFRDEKVRPLSAINYGASINALTALLERAAHN